MSTRQQLQKETEYLQEAYKNTRSGLTQWKIRSAIYLFMVYLMTMSVTRAI
jgi:hypothetical protein